jgi:hypothetical protein
MDRSENQSIEQCLRGTDPLSQIVGETLAGRIQVKDPTEKCEPFPLPREVPALRSLVV